MNNFSTLIQAVKSAQNPEQAIQQAAQNNPLLVRAMEMSQGKDSKQLEQTARNLCEQKGISFEEAMSKFNSAFNGKS